MIDIGLELNKVVHELRNKQRELADQINRDMSYVISMRKGIYDNGEGVTNETVAKVQEILAQKGSV